MGWCVERWLGNIKGTWVHAMQWAMLVCVCVVWCVTTVVVAGVMIQPHDASWTRGGTGGSSACGVLCMCDAG